MPQKDPEARRIYMREYSRRTYQRDKARKWVATKKWRDKNPGKHATAMERYRAAHPERVKAALAAMDKRPHRVEMHKRWKQEHPEKMREVNAAARLKRKLAVQKNGGKCTPEQWAARCDFYGWRCAYCNKCLDKSTVEIDHIKPVHLGGTGWPANLAPACRSCNASKNKKFILPKWLQKEAA